MWKRIDEDREPMDLKEREKLDGKDHAWWRSLSQDSGPEGPSFMLGKGVDQTEDGGPSLFPQHTYTVY